jgi:hypothetical protein
VRGCGSLTFQGLWLSRAGLWLSRVGLWLSHFSSQLTPSSTHTLEHLTGVCSITLARVRRLIRSSTTLCSSKRARRALLCTVSLHLLFAPHIQARKGAVTHIMHTQHYYFFTCTTTHTLQHSNRHGSHPRRAFAPHIQARQSAVGARG